MGTGSRIEERRLELGLGQPEVVRRLKRLGVDIHQTAIDKIEKRDTERPRYLKELAIVLNTTEEWLLTARGPRERPAEPPPPAVEVPIVTWVSAGKLTPIDPSNDMIGTIRVGALDPRGDWIALEVEGDSMDRISPPSSIILVDRRDKRLVPNACYVIADGDNQVTYKRFRPNPNRFEPVSTNPAHEPLFYDHEPAIIGRVKKTILDM